MKRCLLTALCLACAATASCLTVMSWNVRNLFDDVRDGTEYREFDPSRGTWTSESFRLKIDTIGATVRKAVRGGPDILLLQEVENAHALDVLVTRGLSGMGYSWRVFAPKPGLPANVAILSRLPVRRVGTHAVRPWKATLAVRDIVEAEIQTGGRALFVFCLHLKSKTEGVRSTEQARAEAAAVLARRIAEITASDPGADIVAAGDFNESVDEYARIGRRYPTALMTEEYGAAASGLVVSGRPGTWDGARVLFDPWLESPHAPPGSYFYQGEWLSVDHILLSRGLFDARGFSYRRGSFTAVSLPAPPGGGGSDHLPVVLTIDPAG
jgi:endonuclease/exonuclease/phosphatase family metal-dependent hydrolase